MRYFVDKSFTVRRRRKIDINRSAFSSTATAYGGNLQDIRPELQQLYQGQIGRMYDLFIEDVNANIRGGDQVVAGGVTYAVEGVRTSDFGGQEYLHLTVVKVDG